MVATAILADAASPQTAEKRYVEDEEDDELDELEAYLEGCLTIFEDADDEITYLRRRGDVLARWYRHLQQVTRSVTENLKLQLLEAREEAERWRSFAETRATHCESLQVRANFCGSSSRGLYTSSTEPCVADSPGSEKVEERDELVNSDASAPELETDRRMPPSKHENPQTAIGTTVTAEWQHLEVPLESVARRSDSAGAALQAADPTAIADVSTITIAATTTLAPASPYQRRAPRCTPPISAASTPPRERESPASSAAASLRSSAETFLPNLGSLAAALAVASFGSTATRHSSAFHRSPLGCASRRQCVAGGTLSPAGNKDTCFGGRTQRQCLSRSSSSIGASAAPAQAAALETRRGKPAWEWPSRRWVSEEAVQSKTHQSQVAGISAAGVSEASATPIMVPRRLHFQACESTSVGSGCSTTFCGSLSAQQAEQHCAVESATGLSSQCAFSPPRQAQTSRFEEILYRSRQLLGQDGSPVTRSPAAAGSWRSQHVQC